METKWCKAALPCHNRVVTDPEIDARPGSAGSLLLTIMGAHLRAQGGWLPSAAYVDLMADVGVSAGRTRTALTRLKDKGVLRSDSRDGTSGYALTDAALPLLERDDARMREPRLMGADERWFVLSFSVPEERRDVRHQLKRRLTWIGCGSVAGALWIGPSHLVDEAEAIVDDLGLAGRVTVFMVDELRGATEPRVAVERWWDLATIRALHDDFLAAHASAPDEYAADATPATAFRLWTSALDRWRPVAQIDPGLPASVMPEDWPGGRTVPLFVRLRDLLSAPAREHVAAVVAAAG